jgi:hypothetical protein
VKSTSRSSSVFHQEEDAAAVGSDDSSEDGASDQSKSFLLQNAQMICGNYRNDKYANLDYEICITFEIVPNNHRVLSFAHVWADYRKVE